MGGKIESKRLPKSIQKACKIAWKNSMEKSRQKDANLEPREGLRRALWVEGADLPKAIRQLGRPGQLAV